MASLLLSLIATVITADVALAQAEVGRTPHSDLEQRLHAPCCRAQPLEGHESEPARALRREIRGRLDGGEAASLIEADLVRRFGDSIVAIPSDHDPRGGLSVILSLTMVLAFAGLLVVALRWARRSRSASAVSSAPATSDALDDQLDHELRRLDP